MKKIIPILLQFIVIICLIASCNHLIPIVPPKPVIVYVPVHDTVFLPTPVPAPVPITMENLLKQERAAYDLGDKFVGQIDSIWEADFPYDKFPGMKREDSYHTKLWVVASRDSAGHRQRVGQYMDSLITPIWTGPELKPQTINKQDAHLDSLINFLKSLL
jgi:hypothetical protein